MTTDSELTIKIEEFADMFGDDPDNPDYLCPELREYYEPDGSLGTPMLRHPLIYQIPFFSWKLANRSYEAKSKLIDEKIAKGDLGGVLSLYERPYRLSTLVMWDYTGYVNITQLRDLLSWVWTDTENPGHLRLQREIVRMFRHAGFLTDAPYLTGKPDELTIYRGALSRYKRGMSWTLSLDSARFFAERFDRGGKIYSAKVSAKGILAVFQGRKEMEIVVDPRYLRELQEYDPCTTE